MLYACIPQMNQQAPCPIAWQCRNWQELGVLTQILISIKDASAICSDDSTTKFMSGDGFNIFSIAVRVFLHHGHHSSSQSEPREKLVVQASSS
eukprot:c41012_g1_i1 orf=29-307(+)